MAVRTYLRSFFLHLFFQTSDLSLQFSDRVLLALQLWSQFFLFCYPLIDLFVLLLHAHFQHLLFSKQLFPLIHKLSIFFFELALSKLVCFLRIWVLFDLHTDVSGLRIVVILMRWLQLRLPTIAHLLYVLILWENIIILTEQPLSLFSNYQ